MKKKLFLGMVAVLALAAGITFKTLSRPSDSLFGMNLEVLANDEEVKILGFGTCANDSNMCMVRCQGCGQLGAADESIAGPATSFTCSCGWRF